MTLEEVLTYYKTGYNACKSLGIKRQNFTHWRRDGKIPDKQQIRIEYLTKGKLRADIGVHHDN